MPRQGSSPQKRQDALIALGRSRAAGAAALGEPARAFVFNAGAVTLTAAGQIIAFAEVVPKVTGKFKVSITGVVENSDTSATQHPIVVWVSAGAAATPSLQSTDTYRTTAAGASHSTVGFSLVTDLDQAATPTTFALGVGVQINAVVEGDASGDILIAAQGLQMRIEEALL